MTRSVALTWIKENQKRIRLLVLFFLMLALYSGINHFNAWRYDEGLFTVWQTELDDKTPYVPSMVYAYVSWYLQLALIGLPVFFAGGEGGGRRWLRLIYSTFAVMIVADLCFLFFPTWGYRPPVGTTQPVTAWLLEWLHSIDAPTNLFPSTHVAISVTFTYYYCEHALERRQWLRALLVVIWTLLICLSTVFIKQHYWPDVWAGLLLAVLASVAVTLVLRSLWQKKPTRYPAR